MVTAEEEDSALQIVISSIPIVLTKSKILLVDSKTRRLVVQVSWPLCLHAESTSTSHVGAAGTWFKELVTSTTHYAWVVPTLVAHGR